MPKNREVTQESPNHSGIFRDLSLLGDKLFRCRKSLCAIDGINGDQDAFSQIKQGEDVAIRASSQDVFSWLPTHEGEWWDIGEYGTIKTPYLCSVNLWSLLCHINLKKFHPSVPMRTKKPRQNFLDNAGAPLGWFAQGLAYRDGTRRRIWKICKIFFRKIGKLRNCQRKMGGFQSWKKCWNTGKNCESIWIFAGHAPGFGYSCARPDSDSIAVGAVYACSQVNLNNLGKKGLFFSFF